MAITKSAGNAKLAAGCMVLFAMPFLAVGVGTTWQCARLALRHTAMQSWIETPAVIKHAELKVSHDEDTTYKAIAVYDYEFGGRKFTGERVGIDGGSDNVGRFQQNAYRELKRHLDRKKPFRCYVNPDRPSEAVLYRNLRGEMLVFHTIFATAFGSAGLGLATAVLVGVARSPAYRTESVPADAPWMIRADWETGLIPANSGAKIAVVTLAAVALYWSIAMVPLVMKLPEVLARGSGFWKWAAFAFPMIDMAIVVALVYLLVRARKFGESTLHLASTPGVVGGQLAGVVRTAKPVAATEGFRIELICLDWVSDGDGRSEKTIWQDEQLVMEPMRNDGDGTALPVLFAIPFECLETARPGEKREIHWRLDVSAKVPGVDYRAKFDVPVFKTSESRADFQLDERLTADFVAAPNHEVVLRKAGILKEPWAGGVRIVFPMARQRWSAIAITTFLAIWTFGTWAMHSEAPIMAIFFGLFGLLVLWIALDLWFYRSVVEASANGLMIRGGLFGLGRTRVFSPEEIEKFSVKEGMSSDATVWNNILVVLRNGKSRTIGKLVSSKLAQQVVIEELTAALRR